ncbi:hypothetical protein LU276_03965 [Moraxella haemolytica]|uniref:Terminase small subunit n=1 Tax=Moraxella bovoculi TaxID=386891 RepID=A0AAC8PU92_9GAMM|nr:MULTISPECIES: hypothetical protein [Moraxella]AKG07050.1 hypothetical protein AAX06_01345 [Moraxella bovoculi]AKG12199.1 hypothetical protein AAX07_09720 [Moraxella bovoculi]WII95979.1 hypothetical protein LU276_03965 [Moraxella sp. ZY171148]
MTANKPKMGRPTIYSEEIITEFLYRIAKGRSVASVCQDDDMPHRATIYEWLAQYSDFSDRYARASEQRADHYFDEMLDIADKALPEEVQKAKLQIDTRKWVLARMNPKKYSDKHKDDGDNAVSLMAELMKELSNKGE